MSTQGNSTLLKIGFIVFILILMNSPVLAFIIIIMAAAYLSNRGSALNKYKNSGGTYFHSDNTADHFNAFNNFINSTTMETGKKLLIGGVLFVLAVILLLKFIVIIPAGKTGVYHLFGKIADEPVRSGLHFINPLATVTPMSIQTEEYTMSIAKEEGNRGGDDSIDALTNEGLTIKLDLTVFYHLDEEKAPTVYKTLGINYTEKIIRPEIRSAIREVVADYDSKSIYSDKRNEMIKRIEDRLTTSMESRGIIIEQVLLRNVILPPKLDASIQEKLQAEQESQRYDFILATEKKEADRKRIEAEGQRDAQKIIDESLSDKYLNYLYIKDLKDRAGTIYVPINPQTGMPVFKGIQ